MAETKVVSDRDTATTSYLDPKDSKGSIDNDAADVIIVGAGPVGLFFATQLKLRQPDLRIVILEKYAMYKRAHVLKIEAASVNTGLTDPSFSAAVKSLVGRTPTNRIESALKEQAARLGIDIRTGVKVTDARALAVVFPRAKYFIGAGGRRSIVRAQVFGDALCADYNVMRVAFCKYRVSSRTRSFGWFKYMKLLHKADHTIAELVGRPKDGVTSVTLQIFVSDAEYNSLAPFSFREPATPEKLAEVCPSLARSLKLWLDEREAEFKEERVSEPAINRVPLDLYQASRVIQTDKSGHVWAVVGDAAFGLPFFRALNDGFLCATQLSLALAELISSGSEAKLKQGAKKSKTFIASSLSGSLAKRSPLDQYEAFFRRLARRERMKVGMKAASIGIGVSSVAGSRAVKRAKGRAKNAISSSMKRKKAISSSTGFCVVS